MLYLTFIVDCYTKQAPFIDSELMGINVTCFINVYIV